MLSEQFVRDFGTAEQLVDLGRALFNQGRKAESEALFLRAIEKEPNNYHHYAVLGDCYEAQGKYNEAQRAYALSLQKHATPGAFNNIGMIFKKVNDFHQARLVFGAGLKQFPDSAVLQMNLANTEQYFGEAEAAVAAARRALACEPDNAVNHSNLLLMMHAAPSVTPEEIHAETLRWAARHAASIPQRSHAGHDRNPERVLNIGYVSNDMRKHPVAYAMEPVLGAHDRSQVTVYLYSSTPKPDAVTERLKKNVDHWRDISGMSDDDAAALIANDGIDILIDLGGHTADNRLLLFARKPAPVQASWLGYFNSTGVPAMDYFFGDAQVTPPEDEARYTETIVRLPAPYAYQGLTEEGPGPLPALANGYITYGCFGGLRKYTPEMLALWTEILQKVPNARLLLKNLSFDDPQVKKLYTEKLTALGMDMARVQLEGPSHIDAYMLAYQQVDVVLDTFPYNAGATALDALWMGVPLVTLRGRQMMARVAAAHLHSVDLDAFVATDAQDYVRIAVEAAQDVPKLAALREQLRARLMETVMFKPKEYTAALEEIYRQLFSAWVQA